MSSLIRGSLEKYIKVLASGSPTPGGGSASALVGATGIALLLMVSGITAKKLDQPQRKKLTKTETFLRKTLKNCNQIIDLDVKIYQKLMDAYRAAKKTGKSSQVETALVNSFRLQADLALLIMMAKQALPFLHSVVSGSIQNDLLVARAFLDAAFEGALLTARINLKYMSSEKKSHYEDGLVNLEKKFYGIKI